MTSTGAMTQMNTRIEQDLKQRGDVVLAKAGLTPSEAVRALWKFAVAHEHSPKTVVNMLAVEDAEAEQKRQEKIQRRRDSLDEVHAMIDDFYQRAGITQEAIDVVSKRTDTELYEQALVERYEERGLL